MYQDIVTPSEKISRSGIASGLLHMMHGRDRREQGLAPVIEEPQAQIVFLVHEADDLAESARFQKAVTAQCESRTDESMDRPFAFFIRHTAVHKRILQDVRKGQRHSSAVRTMQTLEDRFHTCTLRSEGVVVQKNYVFLTGGTDSLVAIGRRSDILVRSNMSNRWEFFREDGFCFISGGVIGDDHVSRFQDPDRRIKRFLKQADPVVCRKDKTDWLL